MNKVNNKTVAFIFFLTLAVLFGLAIKTSIDMVKETQTPKISGFLIQFENGTTEQEVETILGNYNMTLNYSIDCNVDNGGYKYYIKVNKDKMQKIVGDGLKKDENWTDSGFLVITKGDYIIYPVTEQAIHDKKFLALLETNNLQMKTFVWCLVSYRGNSRDDILGTNCITQKDAIRIKNELEINEKVWTVMPDYIR
jgi:hypothetical protein